MPAKVEEALADAPGSGLAGEAWQCQHVAARIVRAALVACIAPYEDEPGSACLCSQLSILCMW